MKRVYKLAVLFSAIMLLSSCVSFTMDTNDRPTSANKMAKEQGYESLGIVNAQSSSFRFLWFIPVTERAKFDFAVQDAIQSKGGDNIINLKYKTKREIWILGLVTIYKVSGEVIRYKED